MKKTVLAWLVGRMKPHARYLLGALFCAVVFVSLSLYMPILIGRGVDTVVGPRDVDFVRMWPILIQLASAAALSALFQWATAHFTNRAVYGTVRDLRVHAYEKINTLPLSTIDRRAHGDLVSRVVNDVDQISDGLQQTVLQLFTGVVTIAGTLLFMLSISPVIALAVVLITPLSLFVAAFISRMTHKMFRTQQAAQGELGGYIEEMISSLKTVHTFRYEARAQAAFEEINQRLYVSGRDAQFYSSLTNPSTRFVNSIVYAVVAVLGAVCAITGVPAVLTVGQITSFLAYANQYTKPFNEVTGVIPQLQTAMASARRVYDLLAEESEIADVSATSFSAAQVTGDTVALSQVDFSYRKDVRLLQDINITARRGEKIAIVGPTGCGKTTIINLLMRFYDVDAGGITIDGVDIREMPRKALRAMFGMVLQDTWLFSGTVRDNIAYGRRDATQDDVEAAAKAALAHSFIERLPQGYETVISEDGGNLSQGQRQLLCIARVMLVDPPMLILDEATSSIDTRTEVQVQKAFERMLRGRTSFVVAHRLSTIREADCIVVMRAGEIIEKGRHDELIASNGFYASLYNSQFAAAE